MPSDHSLTARQEVVAHLKASGNLTALVSAARIYGEQTPPEPKWPFIRMGLPIASPYEATRLNGSVQRVTVHAFAHGPFTDAVADIAAQVVAAMETFSADDYLVDLQWQGTNVIRDTDEANAYHAVIEFDLTLADQAA